MAAVLYTIGHSRHPAERFVELLRGHAIARLVDVRSQPASRWSPHFGKTPLAHQLAAAGVDYVFLGDALGGRPAGDFYTDDGALDPARRAQAPDFQAGLARLASLARERRTVILCAEEDPARCHRRLLVTPAAIRAGLTVVHVRGDGRLEPEAALAPQLALF